MRKKNPLRGISTTRALEALAEFRKTPPRPVVKRSAWSQIEEIIESEIVSERIERACNSMIFIVEEALETLPSRMERNRLKRVIQKMELRKARWQLR